MEDLAIVPFQDGSEQQAEADDSAIAMLGVATREISISRLLAATLLRASPTTRVALLKALAPHLDMDQVLSAGHPAAQFAVQTEVAIAGVGRIDLLVAWSDGAGVGHVLVVEHKLFASEGSDQLSRYWVAKETVLQLAAEGLGRRATASAGMPTRWAPVAWTMLSLFGEEPSHASFVGASHMTLVPILRAIEGESTVARLARDWARLVDDFYRQGRAPADAVADDISFATAFKRKVVDPLDARYLKFKALSENVAQRAGLEWHGAYRANYSGRRWYGAHLSLDRWFGSGFGIGQHLLQPWIAIQIRLSLPLERYDDVDDMRITIGAFHETLPYLTRAEFSRHPAGGEAKGAYVSLRTQFCEALAEQLDRRRWKKSGDWCQVATCISDIDARRPWSTVARELSDLCVELAMYIDRARGNP